MHSRVIFGLMVMSYERHDFCTSDGGGGGGGSQRTLFIMWVCGLVYFSSWSLNKTVPSVTVS